MHFHVFLHSSYLHLPPISQRSCPKSTTGPSQNGGEELSLPVATTMSEATIGFASTVVTLYRFYCIIIVIEFCHEQRNNLLLISAYLCLIHFSAKDISNNLGMGLRWNSKAGISVSEELVNASQGIIHPSTPSVFPGNLLHILPSLSFSSDHIFNIKPINLTRDYFIKSQW